MRRYNARYDAEPCDAAKDAAIQASEEGAHVGGLLLPAGLNPYLDSNMWLARIWEQSRYQAAGKRLAC